MKYKNDVQRAGRNHVGDWIGISARKWPEKTAIIFEEKRISYKEVDQKANCIANAMLNLGIKKGDIVSVLSHNCPEYVYLIWGAAKIGAIFSPLNFGATPPEIVAQISDNEAKIFFVEDSLVQNVLGIKDRLDSVEKFVVIPLKNDEVPEGWINLDELYAAPDNEPEFEHTGEDPIALLYTSGTTGGMKGCLFTSNNIFAVWQNTTAADGWSVSHEDVALVPAPLFTSTGYFLLVVAPFKTGATYVMQYVPDPAGILELIEKEKCTWVGFPPTLWIALLFFMTREYNFTSVKKAVWFGDAMNLEVLKKWWEMLPEDVLWSPGCSATETGVSGFSYWSREFPLSGAVIGKVHPNAEVRLVDEDYNDVGVGEPGECIMRGPAIMKGYYKRDDINKEAFRNGWFKTGDIMTLNKDGLYYFFDRSKDMIKTGGLNVSCKEVEETLNEHPEVQSSAVFGAPHDYWIEGVVAAVIKKSDGLTEQQLVDFCTPKLAKFKIPKKIVFLSELPINQFGKVLKRELREEFKDVFKNES